MARWNQTDFESSSAKESARKKIVAAAHKHSIEVDDDDNVAPKSRETWRAATSESDEIGDPGAASGTSAPT